MAKTLRARVRAELPPIKGSRFIANASPVSSESAAREFLAEVSGQLGDARHHAAAWRIATPAIDRALDAGEPSGSAGRPILSQLTGRDLVDLCVVVTRYFGGVKLGVGGLVRAYGGAAAAALDEADLIDMIPTRSVVIEHGYEDTQAVSRVLSRYGIEPADLDFGVSVHMRVQLPTDPGLAGAIAQELLDATGGRVRLPRD